MDLFRLKKKWRIGILCLSHCLGMMQPNPIYVRYKREKLESCKIIIVSGFTWTIRVVTKARLKPPKQS